MVNPMKAGAEISIQDPGGIESVYVCSSCGQNTVHKILSIVNSHCFSEDGLIQYWDHYLTICCNGCRLVSFCHESRSTESEECDENGLPFLMKSRRQFPSLSSGNAQGVEVFVERDRLLELLSIKSDKFDLAKLNKILLELNNAYEASSYFSCALLVRAVMDHVPPIFGFGRFSEVSNNYSAGGRSFKEAMQRLDGSCRKIADSYLHLQIREAESIPCKTQVEFRAEFDLLVAEVIRRLRGGG